MPAPTISSPVLAQRQVASTCNETRRQATCRRALSLRFGQDPPDNYGMDQLRGWEGIRVRRQYRALADVHGIAWIERVNDGSSDPLNSLVSLCNAAVYSACEIASGSLLLSPHLGYCHVGKDSWVYDIADCLKAKHSFERSMAWFEGRDRRNDMESMMVVAQSMMPEIVHDVFVEFHDVVDKVLLGEETVR